MNKESWFNFIPFLNQYPFLAQVAIVLCFIAIVCVLIFAYPKSTRNYKAPISSQAPQQPAQEDKQNQQSGIILEDNLIKDCGTGVSAPKDANLKMNRNKFINNEKAVEIRDK